MKFDGQIWPVENFVQSDIPPVLTASRVVVVFVVDVVVIFVVVDVVVVDVETNWKQVGGPEMKSFKSTLT